MAAVKKQEQIFINNSGLTIAEMVVTIGVAALLMGIAIPSFLSWLPTLRLNDAALQVASDLQLARMKAVNQNTSVTVTFTPSNGTYSFGTDSRDLNNLHPGITIASVSPANPVFNSRGTANAATTITLRNANNVQRLVCVTVVGRVHIKDASC